MYGFPLPHRNANAERREPGGVGARDALRRLLLGVSGAGFGAAAGMALVDDCWVDPGTYRTSGHLDDVAEIMMVLTDFRRFGFLLRGGSQARFSQAFVG